MSGVITRNSFPRLLKGDIENIAGNTYKQLAKVHPMIFDMVKSSRAYEEYLELTGVGMATRTGEGAAIGLDSFSQGKTEKIHNYTYTKALAITKEAIEDNVYGSQILRLSPELSKSVVHAEETVAANMLNDAFGTRTYADGKVLCATDHLVSGTGGTYANRPASGVDLSEAALEQAILDIDSLIGSDGLRIDVEAESLIIPNALRFDAHRILKSKLQVDTANNTPNALGDMNLLQKIIRWRFLTDSDAWFIKTNGGRALIFQDRLAPVIESDNEFITKNNLFSIRRRFGVGSEDQRGIYGSPGA